MVPADGIAHLDATPPAAVGSRFPVETDEELGVRGWEARFRAARRDREADGRVQRVGQLGRISIHTPDRHVLVFGWKLTNLRTQESKPHSDGFGRRHGLDDRGLVTLLQAQRIAQRPWSTLDRVEGYCLLMTWVPGRSKWTFAVAMNLGLHAAEDRDQQKQ